MKKILYEAMVDFVFIMIAYATMTIPQIIIIDTNNIYYVLLYVFTIPALLIAKSRFK